MGIAHYLLHPSVWARSNCFLQDLFALPLARGSGVARSLIEAIATQARTRGAARYYWPTKGNNAVAHLLCDKMAKYVGFIRYEFPLRDPGV